MPSGSLRLSQGHPRTICRSLTRVGEAQESRPASASTLSRASSLLPWPPSGALRVWPCLWPPPLSKPEW